MRDAPSVLVIGAGFSGAALAANLLRLGKPVRVCLVNRFGPIGRGVAYGTRLETHVLNVPAGQMSVFPDEPDGFLRFARDRDPAISAGSYVRRQLYGEYLAWALARAEAEAPDGASLERVVGEVRSLEIAADGSGARAGFADGGWRDARRVVLALGNYSPDDPPIEDPRFYDSPRYVRDPWIRGSLDAVEQDDAILLIGTGLTMMDIALDLRTRGCSGPFHAVSRRGLLPHAHAAVPSAAAAPPERLAGARTVRAYLEIVREAAAWHAERGGNWRAVIASLRSATPDLWKRLSLAERARFLRHVRAWWDIHRHRAAPQTAEAVDRMRREGALRVMAGRVTSLHEQGGAVEARLRLRGSSAVQSLRVARVVNCTGPSSDARRLPDPLIAFLRESRLIRPDPLGLGIETDDRGAVLDAEGRPSKVLSLVGPMLKARDWEATAVPELREHAARLARRLIEEAG